MSTVLGIILCLAIAACSNAEPETGSEHSDLGNQALPSSVAIDTQSTQTSDSGLDSAQPPPAALTPSPGRGSISESRYSAIVTAASRVAPAVVSVNVTRRERRASRSPWDLFFMPRAFERLVQAFGSGFIATPDGIVITNQHVTAGAEQIVVTTRDGTDFEAELLGEDPLTDIAVLKIDGHGLPTATFGISTDLVIGEWVVAIGNPYGYLLGNTEPTVTAGVVSAVGRDLIPSGDDSGIYVGMIQTDAAINPGNSGGPLVNALGDVVGVNSSIFTSSGGSVGIGFAIPIERARRVAEELRRFGAVRRAWIGLNVIGSQGLRAWKQTGGLQVTGVAPGSPAARADIRAGDILISAAGHRLRTFLDWEAVKLDVGPGDRLRIVWRRGRREQTGVVVVEDLPTTRAEKISALGDIQLITLTPAVRQERGFERERGALIYDIGDAARRNTGLQPGDLIFRINRQRITQADQVIEAFNRVQGTRTPIRVYAERDGTWFYTDFYVR